LLLRIAGILHSMRRIATLTALALVIVLVGATAVQSASGQARLRLLSSAPLKVKGTGFASGERVVVRLKGAASVTRKRTTANRAGAWVLSFPRLSADRCDVLIVSAVGNRGSRAGLKLPQPLCPPPLSPS
jgi:hypothetical protein